MEMQNVLKSCLFGGFLAVSMSIHAQVDQKCVQQCESSNCTAGDMSSQHLQQCRATCVKNCTKTPSSSGGLSPSNSVPQQETGFMKITIGYGTIAGESREPAHQGWIEVRSFQHGVSELAAAAANNTTGSKGTLVVTKVKDRSSPPLQKACASGEHLKEVVIDVYRAGKPAQRLTLTDVAVSSIQPSPGDPTAESVSLNYARIKD
jgi:type VI secretion system secreted protein Hcp